MSLASGHAEASAAKRLRSNRLLGHVPQKDLANDMMDQNRTSGEFGLPTSTERAFPVKLTPNTPISGWPVIRQLRLLV
jgi:hypothetical protein